MRKLKAEFVQISDSGGYVTVTDPKDIRGFFYRERKIQKYKGNVRILYKCVTLLIHVPMVLLSIPFPPWVLQYSKYTRKSSVLHI